jgi:homotetrameric cytidine deaminase
MKTWNDLGQHSHNRYSDRRQVCVVTGSSGTHYSGVTVENASFPLTISAWQTALFSCISQGDTPVTLRLPNGASADNGLPYLAHFYNLQVTHQEHPPQEGYAQLLRQRPTDFRSELQQLKAFCAIEESRFPVTCLLQVTTDAYIHGVNVELSDWQLGLCAERVAVAKAISAGYTSFKSIHIWAEKGDFISPCGACRQVLVEHMPYERIFLYHPDGTVSEHTPADLLPAFFNGDILK